MVAEQPELSVPVSVSSLALMATECWRLKRWIDGLSTDAGLSPVISHILRRFDAFFREYCVEVIDPLSCPYDPGLALEVIDTVENPDLAVGEVSVNQTFSPIILVNGIVVRYAQVSLFRGSTLLAKDSLEDENK